MTNSGILDYVQNQLSTGSDFMRQLSQDNRGEALPTRDLKLTVDQHIESFLKDPKTSRKWIIIPGLRGVGKTTIAAQTYSDLLDRFGTSVNLLYISLQEVVDVLGSNLYQTLSCYEQIMGTRLASMPEPTFLFIDEVQADSKWAAVLKSIYDKTNNIFIICTGSSAVHLQTNADIEGRRAIIEKLYPLAFSEFQLLQNKRHPIDQALSQDLIQGVYYAADAKTSFNKLRQLKTRVDKQWVEYDRKNVLTYLQTGGLPFALNLSGADVNRTLRRMLDKVIDHDLRDFRQFDNSSLTAIKRLLFILADAGDVVSLPKLSSITGIRVPQIFDFLDALTSAEILIKIPAYGNAGTISRKPARYQFMSPAIRALHYNLTSHGSASTRLGALLEDQAALHYYREFVNSYEGLLWHYYSQKTQGHCDFVLSIKQTAKRIAIEVSQGAKSTEQVNKTMVKTKADYGIVFAKTNLGLKDNIITVPLDYFWLMV